MTFAEACQALEDLYKRVPRIECQGLCQDCCGPLGMSYLEWMRIKRASPLRLAEAKQVACPLLKRGKCTVYALRPLVCRLWGTAENMPCPWSCRPERYLTITEADALMHAVEALSQQVWPGQEPRTMHTRDMIEQRQTAGAEAVAEALAVSWAVLATSGRL